MPAPATGIAISLAAAALADFLFYGHPVGWTLGLYAALLLGTLAWLGHGRLLKTRAPAILTTATAGLIIALLFKPGTLTALLAALGLISLASLRHLTWPENTLDWPQRWLGFVLLGWTEVFRLDRGHGARQRHGALGQQGRRTAVLLVKLFPMAVLAVLFLVLFASANPLIEQSLEQVTQRLDRWLGMITMPSSGRVALWLVAAVYSLALLFFRSRIRFRLEPDPILTQTADFFFNPQTTAIGLTVFNAIFAVQNLLDIGYLWGGARLPEGMTYASYAHRGAYPLVATALLAAVLMLIVFRPSADPSQGRLNRALVYLWIAQNILLTASAAWRLNLYVDVYSLTRLRFAAAVWMLLVGLGLVWICLRIVARQSNQWLINANVLTLLAVLYACAWLDVSGCVARYNVRHCHEYRGAGPNLDLNYLSRLGPSAMPALQWMENNAPDDAFKYRVNETLACLNAELQTKLANWRGWTLQRRRLGKLRVTINNNPLAPQGEAASGKNQPAETAANQPSESTTRSTTVHRP